MLSTLARRAAAFTILVAPGALAAQDTAGLPPGVTTADAPPPITPIKVDGRQVRPGTWTYQITGTGNGQTGRATRELTISPATVNGAAAWLVVDVRKGSNGALLSDSLYLTRGDLQPLRHVLHNPPATILLNYTKDSVQGMGTVPQGSIRMAARNVPGSMATGTMLELYFRMMPLKVGWKGTGAMSVIQAQRNVLLPITIEVAGEETVVVPAGTFPCYVIVLSGQGTSQRAWVSKNTRDIVKVVAKFPQVTGASMEAVLLSKKT